MSNLTSNPWDLTNVANESISTQSQTDPFLLSPDIKNAPNNNYEMKLRFLWYPYNKDYNRIQKSVVKVVNPLVENEQVIFDCPRSLGKPSIFSDLDSILSKRRKANPNDPVAKTIGEKFSRWSSFYSPVYVIEDAINPANTGQCKVLNYGYFIKSQMDVQEKGSSMNAKVQVFDYLTGKNFYYSKRKGSQFGADYKSSKFYDQQSPFEFLKEDGTVHQVSQPELEAMAQGQDTPLKNFLISKLPKMENYLCKEPDKAQWDKALSYLRIILTQFPQIMQELLNSTVDVASKEILMNSQQQVVSQPTFANTQQQVVSQPVFEQPQAQVSQPTAAPQASTWQPTAQQPVQQPSTWQQPQSGTPSQEQQQAFQDLMSSL